MIGHRGGRLAEVAAISTFEGRHRVGLGNVAEEGLARGRGVVAAPAPHPRHRTRRESRGGSDCSLTRTAIVAVAPTLAIGGLEQSSLRARGGEKGYWMNLEDCAVLGGTWSNEHEATIGGGGVIWGTRHRARIYNSAERGSREEVINALRVL